LDSPFEGRLVAVADGDGAVLVVVSAVGLVAGAVMGADRASFDQVATSATMVAIPASMATRQQSTTSHPCRRDRPPGAATIRFLRLIRQD
jgi:hypothetical protein